MAFPLASFRALYPAFAGVDDAVVLALSESAACYVSGSEECCEEQLWMLATAHLLQLQADALAGSQKAGAITSASVGSVSVGFAAPPAGTQSAHWFNLTPYGAQYLVLNKRCNGAPRYIGGSPVRSSIRGYRGC